MDGHLRLDPQALPGQTHAGRGSHTGLHPGVHAPGLGEKPGEQKQCVCTPTGVSLGVMSSHTLTKGFSGASPGHVHLSVSVLVDVSMPVTQLQNTTSSWSPTFSIPSATSPRRLPA